MLGMKTEIKPAVLPIGLALLSLATFTVVGCSDGSTESTSVETEKGDPPVAVAPVDTAEPTMTVSKLRRLLKANEKAQFRTASGEIRIVSLFESGVTDISPLAGLSLKLLDLTGLPINDLSPLEGMPLEELYLENTQVSDIKSLKGMPLQVLRMERTTVSDISPLEGMRIRQLNLLGTQVTKIDAVKSMPLHTLWLTETKVDDLSPLAGQHLESLDISETPISDLRVLQTMNTLKRLNISGSAVTDLTPLSGLRLERLIFTPKTITKGIDGVRKMSSLKEVGTTFDSRGAAEPFWKAFDAGEFTKQ